ncbi:GNAT family N-acetyltransferase [Erwinia sp. MMLR14_017]|uniref:GNAT family N-acetyltransferase n=1 Tax=Erwinia sp. MMLR14_017 TaxID=3093842 RepID=UPI00298F783E|nr:GNAT family N-acetyltransferase [Erwinia sp. MMLR14_017]MDW8847466.1 GNAT family N-acetyltransferase [Erwinia sp. MMLR14_017]
MELTVTPTPTPEDLAEIRAALIAFNAGHINIDEMKDIGVFITGPDGKKLGGLTGTTIGNWLRIDMLWVSEALRGQGAGTRLIRAAEEEARQRGCQYAQVDTASFQARPFYEKMGFTVQFMLENYPRVHQRIYLTKML